MVSGTLEICVAKDQYAKTPVALLMVCRLLEAMNKDLKFSSAAPDQDIS